MRIENLENIPVYHTMINQFVSSFWIERGWIFAHQHCSRYDRMKFYSTQPYRRSVYDIFERTDDDTCSCRETGLNLAQKISIEGHHVVPNCSIQFARATSLRLEHLRTEYKDQFITNLNHCIPLMQIRRLYISYSNFDTSMLIEILCCMLNLDSLSFYYHPLKHESIWSVRQEVQIPHLVSTNKITKVIIGGVVYNTLEDLRFLINLCPPIQYFEIMVKEDALKYIAQITLSNRKVSNDDWP
ncbi:unnamed protein product [Rotaria sordida]|uniref:Uncharacterized protein n=1 Tax=Rotaria sordida TaxID=392033 RepID=A0A819E5I4_9BILA|nr:unnamed protein product [Rotaria sordida]